MTEITGFNRNEGIAPFGLGLNPSCSSCLLFALVATEPATLRLVILDRTGFSPTKRKLAACRHAAPAAAATGWGA